MASPDTAAPQPMPEPVAVASDVAVAEQAPAVAAAAVTTTDFPGLALLCVDLARVSDTRLLPSLLDRAASVLDASGIILWIADPDGRELNPIFAQGYPDQLVNRLGTIPRDAENATAAAFRTSLLQTVNVGQHLAWRDRRTPRHLRWMCRRDGRRSAARQRAAWNDVGRSDHRGRAVGDPRRAAGCAKSIRKDWLDDGSGADRSPGLWRFQLPLQRHRLLVAHDSNREVGALIEALRAFDQLRRAVDGLPAEGRDHVAGLQTGFARDRVVRDRRHSTPSFVPKYSASCGESSWMPMPSRPREANSSSIFIGSAGGVSA